MTLKEIDPALRDMLISWLKSVEHELTYEDPDIDTIRRHVRMLIDALTPFPDIFKMFRGL